MNDKLIFSYEREMKLAKAKGQRDIALIYATGLREVLSERRKF